MDLWVGGFVGGPTQVLDMGFGSVAVYPGLESRPKCYGEYPVHPTFTTHATRL
jgi:hypothetical protein